MIRIASLLTCVVCAIAIKTEADEVSVPQQPVVVWSTQTTNWPERLWVYRVVPQSFADPVVSNLMAIGSFTSKDRAKVPSYLAQNDKRASYFANASKHLAICPTLGYIEYHDDRAEARMTEPVIGVPEEDAVQPVALGYLRLAGIDTSQLAVKPDTGRFDLHGEKITRGYKDKTTGEWTEKVDSRGIFFLRRIDGINVRGIGLHGGASVRFGNNSNLVDLKISWRNLAPSVLCLCPSKDQVTEWIIAGRMKIYSKSGIALGKVEKLNVHNATICYDGNLGDEPMESVFPFIDCEATEENHSGTNDVWFELPMTLEPANWHAVK